MPPKIFRIERSHRDHQAERSEDARSIGSCEIIAEIRALRMLIEPQEGLSQRVIEAFRKELGEAQQMKVELEAIHDAIERTKHEIATVHTNGFKGAEMVRVTGELDAIVQGTFDATDSILTAAETIEREAHSLEASCKSKQDRQAAADIQEQVIKIFEACNFQDLTGQRITKVVHTLSFIEERIVRMMEIWGGIDAFQPAADELMAEREGAATLLNGPKLASDSGHVSQDDIDALFN
jgi:chemotaxis protein CheZ